MKTIERKLKILKKRKVDKKIISLKKKIETFKKIKVKKEIDNFFLWVKGAELVELKSCNVTEDPVRPELDVVFRRSSVSYTHLTLPTKRIV